MAVRRAAVLEPPRKAQHPRPAPGATVGAASRAALREALDHALANVPGVLAGAHPEYLHQLRVGMRRLRAALYIYAKALRADDVRALRKDLRRLARLAGPARDWDVSRRHFAPALRPAGERRRRAAYARLQRALRPAPGWVPPRAIDLAQAPLPDFARAVLEHAESKALKKGGRLDWNSARRRHALRRRLRRLRYACEFLRGAFPGRDAEPLIRSLKRLQALLGDLNDLEVSRRLHGELGREAPRRGARARRLLERLPAAWRAFSTAPRFWR